MRQPFDNHLDRAWSPGHGIAVARVINECRMHKTGQRRPCAASRRDVAQITGQAPSGIKGRAGCGNAHPAQERLEPQERGHGPDLVNHAEHAGGIGVIEDEIGEVAGGIRWHGAGAQPCFDIGMGFVQDHGIRVGGACGVQEGEIAGDRPSPKADRGIIFDLTGHEDTPPLGQVGHRLAKVVFAEVMAGQCCDQCLGAAFLIGAQARAGGDQAL